MHQVATHWVNRIRAVCNTIEFYTLALFVANLPFALTPVFESLIFRICIIALISTWIISGKILRVGEIRFYPSLVAITLLYIFYCLGLAYSANLKAGFFELEKAALLVLLPFVIVTSAVSSQQLQKLLKIFVVSVTLAASICLAYAFYRDSFSVGGVNWLFFTYYDLTDILKIQPNYLALYSCFAIVILLHEGLMKKNNSPTQSGLIILVASFLCAFVVLCSGRTQILIMLILVFGFVMIFFYRAGRLRLGIVVVILLMAVAVGGILAIPVAKERFLQAIGLNQNAQWTIMYGDTTQKDVRKSKWMASGKILRDNWLFGVGTGDVQDELQREYQRTGFAEAYNAKFNAHNQYIQSALMVGLPGLLCLIACFLFAGHAALKSNDLIYFSFILAIAICCFTESVMERQFGVSFFSIFNSLFYVQSFRKKSG